MEGFWEGFEKRARGGITAVEPAGLLYPVNILNALGGTTPEAKKSSRDAAIALSELAGSDKELRKKHLLQYLLNPSTPGPLSEFGTRLMRRHEASKSEHPIRSSLIPLYGMIRGGKAGNKK
jgi:hypothetical protein